VADPELPAFAATGIFRGLHEAEAVLGTRGHGLFEEDVPAKVEGREGRIDMEGVLGADEGRLGLEAARPACGHEVAPVREGEGGGNAMLGSGGGAA
jgi:hypothetical protein